MSRPEVVFVLGGPGAGKGTQCDRIVKNFGYVHLSAGDLLRAERTKGGSLGDMISEYIKEGKIIPVEVTIRLIKYAMDHNIAEGRNKFLIDGFPRNEDNLDGWDKEMKNAVDFKFCLFLDCSEATMEKRLLGRNTGRTDDNIESIRKRFKTYVESTMPIIKRFEALGKVRKIDASPEVDVVSKAVYPLFVDDSSTLIDPVKKSFNKALAQFVKDLAGDAEKGTKGTGVVKQFWELEEGTRKKLLLKAVRATLFNPSNDDDDVIDVKWDVSDAFFMSVSGGYHVNVKETKTDGTVVNHHCRVNAYGVIERYLTPCHPAKSEPPAEEGACVVC